MKRLILILLILAAPAQTARVPSANPLAEPVSPSPGARDRAALAAALTRLADQGNAEASYHLGMMRLLGIGGPKDAARAFTLFETAAKAGEPLAADRLGDMYAQGVAGVVEGDPAAALTWKLVAAKAGYAVAQHDVARRYFDAGDTALALTWLTRAGGQGNADALRALASLYNSDAVPKDAVKTYAYYKSYLRRIVAPTATQQAFLTEFAAKMNKADVNRGNRMIAGLKIAPSDITKRAQAGLRAAEALVASQMAPSAPAAPAEPVGR